jgi:hypothetical protein
VTNVVIPRSGVRALPTPSIPKPNPTNLLQVVQLAAQVLNTLTGAVPSPSGAQAITQNDLVTAGVASLDQSGNLAPAPSAISTALQFAQALQSIGVVSSLPALPDALYPIGAQVVLTTDGKLYRNVGGTWSKSVDGADLIAQSVAGSSIINGAIGTTQIANQAITASQLALSSVTTPALATGAVTAAILAANAVTYQALAAGAVDATKFATGQAPVAVNNGLPNPTGYTGPLTLLNTADGKLYRYLSASSTWTRAVDGADLTANSVTAGSIAAGAITATALAAGAVTTAALAAGSVTTGVIAAGAVTTSLIAAGAITANQLAANSVTAGAISVGALSAISANLGTVSAGQLQDAAGRFVINLGAVVQTITDASGHVRVSIGLIGSDYGIAIYDTNGNKLFDPVQGAWDSTTGQSTSSAISSLTTTVNNNSAAITTEQTARANGDSANAASINSVSVKSSAANKNWCTNPSGENGTSGWVVSLAGGVGSFVVSNWTQGTILDLKSFGQDSVFSVAEYNWTPPYFNTNWCAGMDLAVQGLGGNGAYVQVEIAARDSSGNYVAQYDSVRFGNGVFNRLDSSNAAFAVTPSSLPSTTAYLTLRVIVYGYATQVYWRATKIENATAPTAFTIDGVAAANASATQSLTTSVNSLTNQVDASYTLQLNANGYVSGIVAQNNGTVSNLTIVADNFAITPSSGTGLRTEFSSGNWRVYDANNVLRVRLGIW